MGRSWLLEVVVRLFILLINKSVLLIMTTKTKTQINCGYGGWAEKKTPVAWFSFFFRAAARGSDNGDDKMRKWKKTSWVGRFALNFFRFPSKFYPHCFSLFVATIRARGSPRPLAHVTSGYLPGLSNIRLDLFRSFLSVVSDMCWKFRFHSGFTPFRK